VRESICIDRFFSIICWINYCCIYDFLYQHHRYSMLMWLISMILCLFYVFMASINSTCVS